MSAFSSVRERMVAAGMVDGATGRLTPAGMAYTDRIIVDLKASAPPMEIAGQPSIKWNTKGRGLRHG